MLLSKQPGDTGIYATATSSEVRLYYVLDRVLPFVADKAASALSGGSGAALAAAQLDEARLTQRIAAAPLCVPREHLRMLYRLTASGTGASRTGGVLREADSASCPHSILAPSSRVPHVAESLEQRLQEEAAAASVPRWGKPLIPFHTVQSSMAVAAGGVASGSDFARLLSSRGNNNNYSYGNSSNNKSLQEWTTPTGPIGDDGAVLVAAGGGGNFGPGSAARNGRSLNSAHGVFSASPTTLSLSCATDCLLFFVANGEGHSWVGRSDAATLSPLRVSTSVQMNRHGGGAAGLHGGTRYTGLSVNSGGGGAAAPSSPRPPRPFSAAALNVPGNMSFPTHSFASSERVATPPNTVADEAAPPAATLLDSDCEDDDDEAAAAHAAAGADTSRRGSSSGLARLSSADGLEAYCNVPSTMTALPAGRTLSRHDRVVTASGWDPRSSAILALGRHGGVVQLLDVEYVIGSAASTRCSSTTSSAASDDTAEPFSTSVNGAARTATSGHTGGPHVAAYGGADHLSYSVIQQREMVGPVTALDWMPQSHLTVVAARRRDGLGCYAELLDLRASHDGITYLGAPPEVFGVPVYARGADSAAPSVLCSAERVACHPSQRYVATVGTSRMRDIVQLWDVRMATRPVAYQVYARAGYTSLCWSAADTGVVLGTTRDGGLRAHTFKELATRSSTTATCSSRANANAGGSGAPTAFGGGSHHSRRRRGTSGDPQPPFTGGSGEQDALNERWGVGNGDQPGNVHNAAANNNSGYSGTEAEVEDDALDDSGSLRSGVSIDGAGTALSSVTEGSSALVHVSVKAQSALKCRLPSRVPAAAVAWVCRPAADATAGAAAVEQAGGLATSPLLPHARGGESCGAAAARQRRANVDADADGNDDGANGEAEEREGEVDKAAARVSGVIERGCRTDLPQLLLLNSKNGELYTQVYNPRGSIVTILNQSMGLVGAGPNAFIVKAPASYKSAMHAYEELLIQQLEQQAVLADAATAAAAHDNCFASATPPPAAAVNGAGGNSVATAVSSSSGGSACGSAAPPQQHVRGSGEVVESHSAVVKSPAAATRRRLKDHRPVDLMGLGLLDEDDDEEDDEEEEREEADDRERLVSDCREGHGDARDRHVEGATASGDAVAEHGGGGDGAATTSFGEQERAGGQAAAGTSPPGSASQANQKGAPTATGPVVGRRKASNSSERGGVRAAAAGGTGAGEGCLGYTAAPLLPSSLTHPVSPVAEGVAAAAGAASLHTALPPELGYCQFHRIERARLIWRRLRGGFSCDPIGNLRVLLQEGVDREAYATFLYGCCASMLLYPSCTAQHALTQAQNAAAAGDAPWAFPLVVGARHAVPGLLELLVSERRLRTQLGLRDTRLSSRFHLRQHPSTLPSMTRPTTEAPAATSAGTSPTPFPPVPPVTAGRSALGFAAPLLPGLPGMADERTHKVPPGFFRSPFEVAAATMRGAGTRLPTPGSLTAVGGMRGGGSDAAGRTTATTTTAATSMLRRSDGAKAAAAGGGGRGAAAAEQPTHAAAIGTLHQLILQSMGWVAPPLSCQVDNPRGGKANDGAGGGTAITAASAGGGGAAEDERSGTLPSRTSARHASRHPAERFFVQGDGLGQQSLQEALERRVAVLVLLDRLDEAAELLSLHSTRNAQYPSIALTLSAAREQTAALRSLAAPDSTGVTFWVHLLLTYVELLMAQQSRRGAETQLEPTSFTASQRVDTSQTAARASDNPAVPYDADEGVSANATTRFDRLFTLAEQRAVALRLLRGYPRLAMPDKVALAAALLLPPSYHGGHMDNLIEVLQILVHQQYRNYAGLSAAAVVTLPRTSNAEATGTAPHVSPAASLSPSTAGTQHRMEGKRLLPLPAMPLTLPSAPCPPNGLTDVAAAELGGGAVNFPPVCGCSLLLVTAVEGLSTDCRALQRYIDECGDAQTTLCYTAVFGNVTTSTFRLWREAYRQQLNEQGFSMWRSQFDLQCVKLLKAREAAEKEAARDGRVEGATDAAAGIGFDVKEGRVGGVGSDAVGAGASSIMAGVMSAGSGIDSTAIATASTTVAAATLLHTGVAAPKGFSTSLNALGTDMTAGPAASAAAMMSTQTAMMMKRTLKGFAQTAATSTAERDRSMREAAAAGNGGLDRTIDDLHRTVELRCNCGQAMHATAPGKSSMSPMVSTNLTRKQLIPCGNPECRQWQTPMCTVCGERMEHRATELPPERFFAWCSVCLHGGHWCHLREWFAKHTKCPVENCPCHCCDGAHLA